MSRIPALRVVDLHADLLWRVRETGKDAWERCEGESLDLPRMLAWGPSIQCFTLFTPSDRSGTAATCYAEELHAIWTSLVERGAGRLGWIRTRGELLAAPAAGLAGILTMEGASPLRGDVDLLAHFVDLGVRSLGLTHNPRNEAGDGCLVPHAERGGLTEFGRALVRRCTELGVLLDVAHLAIPCFWELMDVLQTAPAAPPVVSTHTGCAALTDHPRNLDDRQLRALAESGGLAGITLFPPHVRREGRPDTLANALDHVEHVAEVCGIEHVALGADLDGFSRPGFPDGGDTSRCYGQIADGLRARGFTDGDVALVLGENAVRVLAAVLPA